KTDKPPLANAMSRSAAKNQSYGQGVMTLLLDRRGTEGMVRIVARSFGQEVMTLLLDRWGDDVKITEEVVMAAAGNWR
ncbi:hypothetical protein V8E54_009395, partial [Elaphomyces granulatus]